jgi:hypothetical protein
MDPSPPLNPICPAVGVIVALLEICILAASWAEVRELVGKNAERETVSTTIHKLMHGELLQGSGPAQRGESEK